MRIVIVSDTHGLHDELGTLEGDLLIHCGDFENTASIDAWFATQRFEQIVVVAGNHDYAAAESSREDLRVFYHAEYLEDTTLEYGGLKIYGSPWMTMFEDSAFYLQGNELQEKWNAIPDDTDILITHVPPYQILDTSRNGEPWGCKQLRERIEDLPLRFHCFGHVHASRGQMDWNGITFYNAANISAGEIIHKPIVVDL